jgi:CBS domain-containing protein
MGKKVRDLMTENPTCASPSQSLVEAARMMRDEDVGSLPVCEDDRVIGIVTDRDIVVRAVAEGMHPEEAVLAQVASKELVTLSPDASMDEAVELMRSRAVRRLPVVEDGRPVGIVTLGDLAVEQAPESTLADISAADPNR